MAMCYTWTFICNLRDGCGAVIKIKSDRYDGHPFIRCPVCKRNARYTGKE
jgi:hypothetical protein